MRKKQTLLPLLILILFSIIGSSWAENAFTPLFENPENSTTVAAINTPVVLDADEGVHPLLQREVQDYILMAVIVSDSTRLGLIRANNGAEYFIRIGDLLGKSEGKISNINSQGIEVTEEEKVVILNVRNRSASNENTE